jgi:hypothetical protein
MLIELDDFMLDKIIAQALLDTYRSVLDNPHKVPIFSTDKEEEDKQVKKLLKSIEMVHNWYNVKPLQERLKQEQALEELSDISQELELE